VDSIDHRRKWSNAPRRKRNFFNGRSAGRYVGFSTDRSAIRKPTHQMDIGKCRRKYAPANRQDFAAHTNRFREVPRHMRERGKKKIPKIMADQAASGMKAILKQASQQRFVFRESNHAIADVARWKDAIFSAKTSGASAIIGDGHDGCQLTDGAVSIGVLITAADDVFLEPA
jgi:hypothetical protein